MRRARKGRIMQRKRIVFQWEEFYKYRLQRDVDFSDFRLPLFFLRFRHYIFVPKGISCRYLFEKHAEFFPDSYALNNHCSDLKNERSPEKAYIARIAHNEKKDYFFFGKSAHEIQEMGIKTLTLLECLLWLLQYKFQWRKFPTENYILCCGTFDRYGSVPRVFCGSQTLKIEFVGTHVNGSLLHTRRVFAH